MGLPVLRPVAVLAERGASGAVRIRTADGGWDRPPGFLKPFDSMLSETADPRRTPELLVLRERIRSWRFYDHLRTDAQAPARTAQVGTRTPVLSHDGADLAAALQTIREIGDADALDEAVGHAFPAAVSRSPRRGGRFEWRCASRACCGCCEPPSSQTEQCATCWSTIFTIFEGASEIQRVITGSDLGFPVHLGYRYYRGTSSKMGCLTGKRGCCAGPSGACRSRLCGATESETGDEGDDDRAGILKCQVKAQRPGGRSG